MLRTLRIATILSAMALFTTAVALAQPPHPPTPHDFALNANFGFAQGFHDEFDDFEPFVSLAGELYVTPEVSLRAMAGFTSFDADINGNHNEADVSFATAGAIYNFLDGPVHPFVGGGLGLYDREFDGPNVAGSDEGLELGFHAGGGADFFFGDHWALRVEAAFHGMTGDEPDSFGAATIGGKYRF